MANCAGVAAPKKLGDLRRRGGGLVGGPRKACCRGAGDPPPPRETRLARRGGIRAVGVRQRVAGWHIHQQEGIERHPEPARLHLAERLHHGKVGRSAAIDRPVLGVTAHQMRIGPRHAIDRPDLGAGELGRHLHARLDRAAARPQVIAEPGNDQADAFHGRGHGL